MEFQGVKPLSNNLQPVFNAHSKNPQPTQFELTLHIKFCDVLHQITNPKKKYN